MLLLLVAVLAGAVAGLVMNFCANCSWWEFTDGLRSVVEPPTRELWILGVGAGGAALVGLNVGNSYANYVLAISLTCVIYGALLNRHLPGMSLVALGAALNLIPLLTNGYLPVDPQALVAAGIVDADSINRVVLGAGRQLQGSGDLLSGLGPIIGISWTREVVSFGDFVLAAGIANVLMRVLYPPWNDFAEDYVEPRSAVPVHNYEQIGRAPAQIPPRPRAGITTAELLSTA